MKKVFFSLLCSILSFLHISASFEGDFTHITWDAIFKKNSWVHELRVREDYFINPFSWSTIVKNTVVCTGNNCPCWPSGCTSTTWYSIDWVLFWPSHPQFKNVNEVLENWHPYSDGISSRVEYRENTYTQSWSMYIPDQSVKVRRYYIASYQHDTSAPTCWGVNYYNDKSLTESFSYTWGWLNSPKYFTMTCLDGETWCYCAPDDQSCIENSWVITSTPQLLWHNIKPQVSFTNTVKLTDPSCEPGWEFQKVFFDLKIPTFNVSLWWESFNLNLEALRDYKTDNGKKINGIDVPGRLEFTRSWSINRIAGDMVVDLQIEDSYLTWSVHWVSGIQEYNFSITRLTNQSFENIAPFKIPTCSRWYTSSTLYNPNWDITISDVRNNSFECSDLLKSGKYNFEFTSKDWAWNSIRVDTIVNIYPDVISQTNSVINTLNSEDTLYANNVDSYDYEVILRDRFENPIFDRIISKPIQSIQGYNLWETILLPNSISALKYDIWKNTTDKNGIYTFSTRSLSPGNITHRYSFEYIAWDNNYVQNQNNIWIDITDNNTWTFNKPFTADMTFLWPWDNLVLWTLQDYQIDLTNIGGMTSIINPRLDIRASTLWFSSWHRFSSISNVDNTFSLDDLQCRFSWVFDSTSWASTLQAPEIDINNMDIRYVLDGEQVRYKLDAFGIQGCSFSTLWVKSIGTTQWSGKFAITWWSENFSDVSTSLYRSQIRENAYQMIRWLTSETIVNAVRYVDGDVSISWDQDYETLIVKNGNVFIQWDLNTSENTFGIIVLKDDGYDVSSDFNNSGNIYVWNNVEYINAQLYADGALLSANESWERYQDGQLGTKLHLKWTIFTRNTIGWWILAGSDYILPGWETSTDRILASIYDLNFLRRAQVCWEEDDYSFLIEYNPSIQINPPRWFQTN